VEKYREILVCPVIARAVEKLARNLGCLWWWFDFWYGGRWRGFTYTGQLLKAKQIKETAKEAGRPMNKYMQSRSIHTILCSTLPRILGSIRSCCLLLLCFRAGSLSSSPSAHITKMKLNSLLVTFSASSFCFALSSTLHFSSSCYFVF